MGKTQNRPLVSVIVPIYNVEPYLRECVDSIICQTYCNIEIILVDDGSPDGCPSICDEYAATYSNIRVIHKPNGGLSDARNTGLAVSKGDFVTFVDSDDWLEVNMVERCVELIEENEADFCGVSFMLAYHNRRMPNPVKASGPEVYSPKEALARYLFNTNIGVCVWGGVYRRTLWENVKCPVGKLHEDQHTKYLLLDQARRVVFDPEPLYNYRQREGSIGHSAFSKRSYDLLEGVDIQYDYISKKYPDIEGDIGAACSFWYAVFVNMMLKGGCCDDATAKRCQRFVRVHIINIINNKSLLINRKLQLLLFALSFELYKLAYIRFVNTSKGCYENKGRGRK